MNTQQQIKWESVVARILQNPELLARRISWPQGEFLFYRPEDTVPEHFVPRIKTIPESVKKMVTGDLVFQNGWATVFVNEEGKHLITSFDPSRGENYDDWVIVE